MIGSKPSYHSAGRRIEDGSLKVSALPIMLGKFYNFLCGVPTRTGPEPPEPLALDRLPLMT